MLTFVLKLAPSCRWIFTTCASYCVPKDRRFSKISLHEIPLKWINLTLIERLITCFLETTNLLIGIIVFNSWSITSYRYQSQYIWLHYWTWASLRSIYYFTGESRWYYLIMWNFNYVRKKCQCVWAITVPCSWGEGHQPSSSRCCLRSLHR
jgi:hypothetical protein